MQTSSTHRRGLFFFLQNSESISGEIFEPWAVVNRELMHRAVGRGEISTRADIEMAFQVITSIQRLLIVDSYSAKH